MKKLMGSPGTKTGLILRLGQCGFATASIAVMVSTANFYSVSAFWILVPVLGLQVLWSFGVACVDVHALRVKRDLQKPSLVVLTAGDWVTSTFTLAATCSSAAVVLLYSKDLGFCKLHYYPCGKYELSVAFAFLSWFLVAVSSHIMLWILPSSI